MTKQLSEKLLKWYENSLQLVKCGYDFKMDRMKIIHGICNCADHIFGEDIYEDEDIQNELNGKRYLYTTPNQSKSNPIPAIEFRINFLKNLISKK